MRSLTAKVLYILGFAAISTVIQYALLLAGYRYYINWNVWNTFLLGTAVHSVLALYLARVYYAQPENLKE